MCSDVHDEWRYVIRCFLQPLPTVLDGSRWSNGDTYVVQNIAACKPRAVEWSRKWITVGQRRRHVQRLEITCKILVQYFPHEIQTSKSRRLGKLNVFPTFEVEETNRSSFRCFGHENERYGIRCFLLPQPTGSLFFQVVREGTRVDH